MRHINEAGLALIKTCEGFRSYPYRDGAGICTIGYGHTKNVTPYTTPITEEQAEDLLKTDLAQAQDSVDRFIMVALNDNQYAALVSLTFNAGDAPLRKTLGQHLNAGEYDAAATEFDNWVFAGGVKMPGLCRRRMAEKALFLTPLS